MIRIGSLLAVNPLAWGRIIDKIMVYGLLLDYYNFITDESVFFIGDEINAVKGFIGIVRAIKNATS